MQYFFDFKRIDTYDSLYIMPVWQECQPPKNPYKVTLYFIMSLMLPPDFYNPLKLPDKEAFELHAFADLVRMGISLTREDVDKVFAQVPLIVLADDDDMMREILYLAVTDGRQKARSIAQKEGDMAKCFDDLKNVEPDELPVILCHDGLQAETATQILCERQIGNGLLVFDHQMGFPRGLDIFQKLNGKFPSTTTRALFSGNPPANTQECLKKGMLDVSLPKPPRNLDDMRAQIAEAYLKKIYPAQK